MRFVVCRKLDHNLTMNATSLLAADGDLTRYIWLLRTVDLSCQRAIVVRPCLPTTDTIEKHIILNGAVWLSRRKTAQILDRYTQITSGCARASHCHLCCATRTTGIDGQPLTSEVAVELLKDDALTLWD